MSQNNNKHCNTCKEVKLFSEFYSSKAKKDGKESQCKTCVSIKHQERYAAKKNGTYKKALVFGVGLSDIPNPKNTKSYRAWINMLKRCYDEKTLFKQPTYINCIVCDEWLIFSNFKKWHNVNYVKGYQIDKDLLITGNKLYSPETCLYISPQDNLLMIANDASRGECPVGVHKKGNKFVVQLSVNGKQKYLGQHSTQESSSKAYLKAKSDLVYSVAMNRTGRLRDALIRISAELLAGTFEPDTATA